MNDYKQNRLSILFGFSILFIVIGMGIILGTNLLVLGVIFIVVSVIFLFIFIIVLISVSRKEISLSQKEEKRRERLQRLDREDKDSRKKSTKVEKQKELTLEKNLQIYILKTTEKLRLVSNDFNFCLENNLPFIIDELTSDTVCAICKLRLKNELQALQCPFCKSIFHIEHLLTWMYDHKNCPVCKQQLRDKAK